METAPSGTERLTFIVVDPAAVAIADISEPSFWNGRHGESYQDITQRSTRSWTCDGALLGSMKFLSESGGHALFVPAPTNISAGCQDVYPSYDGRDETNFLRLGAMDLLHTLPHYTRPSQAP